MKSFIFGGDGMPKTPQELARMRRMAEALNPSGRVPSNAGEGLASIGQAIAYRLMQGRADKAEKAGIKGADDAWANLFNPVMTPAETPTPDPSALVTADIASSKPDMSLPPVKGTMENARVNDRNSVQDYAGLDLKSGIKASADALGIAPEDLATAISYETAGTFNPTKKGPRTKWGQHRGLIQFGEPQAEKYGVNWNDPLNSQLGPEGAVVKYLRDAGVKPGMSLLDVYSAINAGGVNRYDASDEANGGAPGTVADKVNNQMDGHRQKALALFAEQPATTAFDSQPGLTKPATEQVPVVPVPEGFELPDPLAQDAAAKPVEVADNSDYFPPRPVEKSEVPRKKITEALSRKKTNDFDVMKAIEVMNNPFLDDGKKAVAAALIKRRFAEEDAVRQQELKQADPAYQMDLEKGQLELENLRHPKQAKTMTQAEEEAMGLPTDGVYQILPDNSVKTVREPSKPIDALNAQKTQIEINKLNNPDKATELSAEEKKALGLPADGVYQRKADRSIVTVREPEKATQDWAKLDDGRLFNQRSGEIKDVAGNTVGFRFPGNSPEAAALNGLIENGTLTEKQAMDIAAGKQMTGPNGEIIFATPQALIGAQPQQTTQNDGIDLFADLPKDPTQAVDPAAIATDKPADAVPVMEQPNSGMIPLTKPKVTESEKNAMTYADRMSQSGAIIDSMGLKGTNTYDQNMSDWLPFGLDNYVVSDDFKKVDQAKRDFINAQLRRESGAAIGQSEFDSADKQYFPQPNDSPERLEQKRRNRQTVIDGMIRDAGPTYKAPAITPMERKKDEDVGPAPKEVEPEVWKHMTPEERKLWQN